jgi:hypothetical protein
LRNSDKTIALYQLYHVDENKKYSYLNYIRKTPADMSSNCHIKLLDVKNIIYSHFDHKVVLDKKNLFNFRAFSIIKAINIL